MPSARRLLVLSSSLIGAVALLAPAAADAHSVPTRVHFRQVSGKRAYHGRVISPRSACLDNRRLRIYHDVTGGPDTVVAHATSTADGTWRTAVPFSRYHAADFYYARVSTMKLSGTKCAGAKSAYAQAIA